MSDEKNSAKVKAAMARSASLTAEERKIIARKAASARWDADVPLAAYEGQFSIGSKSIAAVVLPNGKRLLTQSSFLTSLGRSRSPKAGTGVLSTVDGLPFFLQADALKPFINNDLIESTTPIFFRDKTGKKGVGYDAHLLPAVAEIYLRFRDATLESGKPVPKQYAHIIKACDAIVRGLAQVGIIALVDEATGYQEVRDRHALQAILDRYLAKELAAWAKRFPDEFYKEMFRLKDWSWNPMSVAKPGVVGRYTVDLIYDRLAPELVAELERLNPKNERGNRRSRHHQWLSEDVGHPALAQHLHAVISLMRISTSWEQFKKFMDIAHPRKGSTMELMLEA